MLNVAQICGLLGILGACIYAIGDILLLADKVGPINPASTLTVDFAAYPQFRRRAHRLAAMARLPWWRLVWGGLLGVFAAPLTLAGLWMVYQGLQSAGTWLAVPPILLFTYASVIAPFVHGSFIYLGATIQTINMLDEQSRSVGIEKLLQQQKVIILAYAVLFACFIPASIWFSVAVGMGKTHFPVWMAVTNPVILALVWLSSKRILPAWLTNATEGAGFNIAYIIFLGLATATLW